MSAATPLLSAVGLRRHFVLQRTGLKRGALRVRAVDDVSFHIDAGETLGLVGESGCGKSTVGRLVLGLERPDAGSVSFEGESLAQRDSAAWRKLRRRAQMIFQDPLSALDPRLPVGRQIVEPLEIHRIGAAREHAERLAQALDAVGLPPEAAQRYPHELSGGQLQRVVIARALVLEPRLVVCDEPVSALDVSVQAQVVNLLAELQRSRHIAYLFISHDLKVVRHLSHRVAVMYLGNLVELAGREALFREPLHPYTQALIAAVPVPDPTRRGRRMVLRGDPPSAIDPPSGCRFHTRCPHAEGRCRTQVPLLREVSTRRWVACHLAAASPQTEAKEPQ
jgi:oligopeptide/dipeptide ABC transporter ATP-binding protein